MGKQRFLSRCFMENYALVAQSVGLIRFNRDFCALMQMALCFLGFRLMFWGVCYFFIVWR